jgi:hypothetical protein
MQSLLALVVVLLLQACTMQQPLEPDSWADKRQADGSVVWLGEYQFTPPVSPWITIDLNETDLSLAFFKSCDGKLPGEYPCESSLAYAEEPFGYSRDLKERSEEFFKRYLWAARVVFDAPVLNETEINGRKALVAEIVGEEPVRKRKVHSKVIFMHRGERVVAFFMNQWRPEAVTFDPAEFELFDQFVASFRFIKPSFYEML